MKKNIIIVLLSLLVVAMGGYLIYDTFFYEKNGDDKNIEKPKLENKELISQTEVESFLDPLISEYYNLLIVQDTDEDIFTKAIQYLVANNKYIKNDYVYVFNQTDINELARKYFMKDNFNYITSNSNFEYNSDEKTFSSTLQFGVFEISPKSEINKSIAEFNSIEDTANFIYNVEFKYMEPEFQSHNAKYSYKIIVEKENNNLKIKSIEQL